MSGTDLEQRLNRFHELVDTVPGLMDDISSAGLFPQVMIVGMQSAGKSAVLEALTGLSFNFAQRGMATRVPLRVSTVFDAASPRPAWTVRKVPAGLRGLHVPGLAPGPCDNMKALVRQVNTALAENGKGASRVCTEPLVVEVRWERAFNFTFTDFPGFQTGGGGPEERAAMDAINRMGSEAIAEASRRPNAIIMYVEDGHADVGRWTMQQWLVQNSAANVIAVLNKIDDSIFTKEVEGDASALRNTCGMWPGAAEGFVQKLFLTSSVHFEEAGESLRARYEEALRPLATTAAAAEDGALAEVGRALAHALSDDGWCEAPPGLVGVGGGSLRAYLVEQYRDVLMRHWGRLEQRVGAALLHRNKVLENARQTSARHFISTQMATLSSEVRSAFHMAFFDSSSSMYAANAATEEYGRLLEDEYTEELEPDSFLATVMVGPKRVRWDVCQAEPRAPRGGGRGRARPARPVWSSVDDALGCSSGSSDFLDDDDDDDDEYKHGGGGRGGGGGHASGPAADAAPLQFSYRTAPGVAVPHLCIPGYRSDTINFQAYTRVCSELVASLLVCTQCNFPSPKSLEQDLLRQVQPGKSTATLFMEFKELAWKKAGAADFALFSEYAAAAIMRTLDASFMMVESDLTFRKDIGVMHAGLLHQFKVRVFRRVKRRVQQMIEVMGPSFVESFVLEPPSDGAEEQLLPQQDQEGFVDAVHDLLNSRVGNANDAATRKSWKFLSEVESVTSRNITMVTERFAVRAAAEVAGALEKSCVKMLTLLQSLYKPLGRAVEAEIGAATKEMKGLDLPDEATELREAEAEVDALVTLLGAMADVV